MARRFHIFLLGLITIMALYIGLFSFWWLRSPSHPWSAAGKPVRVVEFQYNALSWHTEPAWAPAFWFVEHVLGYRESGFVAMYERSVRVYLR